MKENRLNPASYWNEALEINAVWFCADAAGRVGVCSTNAIGHYPELYKDNNLDWNWEEDSEWASFCGYLPLLLNCKRYIDWKLGSPLISTEQSHHHSVGNDAMIADKRTDGMQLLTEIKLPPLPEWYQYLWGEDVEMVSAYFDEHGAPPAAYYEHLVWLEESESVVGINSVAEELVMMRFPGTNMYLVRGDVNVDQLAHSFNDIAFAIIWSHNLASRKYRSMDPALFGFYTFVYICEPEYEDPKTKYTYVKQAEPQVGVTLSDLPDVLRELAKSVTFARNTFTTSSNLQPLEIVKCSGHLFGREQYLCSDSQTLKSLDA